jgi:alkyl sulfatase BDS1-like metallo-beta-lactamase superfamily hydrolase
VHTQLGYGAENGTWRNNYLTAAAELRQPPTPNEWSPGGMAAALTITQLFDSIAIRINGPRAWDTRATVRWHFTDTDETYRMELSNGVLIHHPTRREDPADLVVTLTKPQLLALVGGSTDGIQLDGDASVLQTILGLTDQPDPNFAIVTP